MIPTTKNSGALNVAWASSMAMPPSSASGLPAPMSSVIRPSWETVPYASSSFRSRCRSAIAPPYSRVAPPRIIRIGCQTVSAAKAGASRANR